MSPPVCWVNPSGAGDGELAERGLREALAICGWPADDLPVMHGPTAADAVAAALESTIPADNRAVGPLRFVVDGESVSPRASGPVAGGRVLRGTVRVGDAVDLLGPTSALSTVVLGISYLTQPLALATPPNPCDLWLRHVTSSQIERGHLVATPGTLRPATAFDANIYLPAGVGAAGGFSLILHGVEVRASLTTAATPLGGLLSSVPADTPARVTLRVPTPVRVWPGMRFAVCEQGARVGVGSVAS